MGEQQWEGRDTSESDNLAAMTRSAGTGTSGTGSVSCCPLALLGVLLAGLLLAGLALPLAAVKPAGFCSLSTSACQAQGGHQLPSPTYKHILLDMQNS